MDKIIITGGNKLKGTVEISGSKNATLPIMAASILTDEEVCIKNVANLKDVSTMISLLDQLGLNIERKDTSLKIQRRKNTRCYEASYELVSQMRASICVLGPLLAKYKKAKVSLPGGCVIGPRPVDLHLKALAAMGADIVIEHGFIVAKAKKLKGVDFVLETQFGSSVLATANVMMAAVLADGKTTIRSAACEPEIVDLAKFLKKMGANIRGAGTSIIEIEGVDELKGVTYKIISDRIEAGTYLIAGAITDGELEIKNIEEKHLGALIAKLKEMGQELTVEENKIKIKGNKKNINFVDITTSPYPGFPTDMQAQMMSLLCFSNGSSVVREKVYPDRFMHISELNRMGANITFESGMAIVKGVGKLTGANVMASDLRASAGLVLAGLSAEGYTEISRVYHLDRGYEQLEEKLLKVGAEIKRIK